MSEDIIPTARIIETRLDGTVNRADIEAVLAALLELRKEYRHDPLAFESRHSRDQSRLGFDRRILAFVDGGPAAGVHRMHNSLGGLGGRMS